MNYQFVFIASLVLVLSFSSNAQNKKTQDDISVWNPDNGDGTYKNPIIYADYSDPDAIRVGDDFYMTSSSFNCIPGLPILRSKDLVNWQIITYALPKFPADEFCKPQLGKGVWAPAIRYHNGEFYIYFPEPDLGIYLVKAKNPEGPWSEPILVKSVKGWIDPCPFWDEDGNAFLVHAFAGSRNGLKSIIAINKMSEDGTKLLDEGVIVFDGHENHPTMEGPKMYKRNGYYYIFAPAGGVPTGWQTVLRSKSIYGPYEDKIVMDQGKTETNGPHQGALLELESGEFWFIHFQDKDAYGRIVHLQPVKWVADWPVIGIDKKNTGKGEPTLTYKKPISIKDSKPTTPQTSDEFNSTTMGLQWQWNANYLSTWAFNNANEGILRLYSVTIPPDYKNFSDIPNLLLQKFPAPDFTASTKLTFAPKNDGEETGLIVNGIDYSRLAIQYINSKLILKQFTCKNAPKGNSEVCNDSTLIETSTIYLKVKIVYPGICKFFYSITGKDYIQIGEPFTAKEGTWIGAKVGLFCIRKSFINDGGYADFDWFRIEKE
ncbi:MAG: glycoside hydrolase 43 family protein [Bacteroidales bacterium]